MAINSHEYDYVSEDDGEKIMTHNKTIILDYFTLSKII